MFTGHTYARALRSHFRTLAALTALLLDASSLIDEIDLRRLQYVRSSLLQCTCPIFNVIQKDGIQKPTDVPDKKEQSSPIQYALGGHEG